MTSAARRIGVELHLFQENQRGWRAITCGVMISSSIDPLVALIASVAADPLAALIAAVAVLSVFFSLLAWRQQRRLAVMQTQLRNLSRAVRNVEYDQGRLLIKSLKSRKARKSPSSDTLEQKMAAPAQAHEKTYVGAPKNISRMKAVGD